MSILDDLKTVGKTLQEVGKLDQYEQILEARKQLLEMQEEISELKIKLGKFEAIKNLAKNLVFEKNAYYLVSKNSDKDGPYCPRCWDDEKKQLRMQKIRRYNVCPKCQTLAEL